MALSNKKKKKKKKQNYINNKEFEQVIHDYLKDSNKENETKLCNLLDLLITNIIHSFKFQVDAADAKQECFLLAFKILKNFKPSSGSAFNYFTTVIVNNLKLMYTKNKKYVNKLQEYKEIKNRTERYGTGS